MELLHSVREGLLFLFVLFVFNYGEFEGRSPSSFAGGGGSGGEGGSPPPQESKFSIISIILTDL